jgi:cation transport regulator ChaB
MVSHADVIALVKADRQQLLHALVTRKQLLQKHAQELYHEVVYEGWEDYCDMADQDTSVTYQTGITYEAAVSYIIADLGADVLFGSQSCR